MIWLAAIIGYAINGPFGALIGFLIAWALGFAVRSFVVRNNNHVTDLFLNSLFAMLAKIAKADGIITKEEIDAVTQFMNHVKLSSADKKTAINAFRSASVSKHSIYEYASQYSKLASGEMRGVVYAVLWDVAYSDGILHEKEDEILRRIPEYLGLNSGAYHQYKDRIHNQNDWNEDAIDKAYEILGCSKDSSIKEIKKSYKRAIAKHHPDKIHSQGLPKEFMDYANEQSKSINKAYDLIKKYRHDS